MMEIGFPLLLWVTGFVTSTALFANSERSALFAWTGFLSGALIWLLGALLYLWTGVGYTPLPMLAWMGAALVLAGALHIRRGTWRLSGSELRGVGLIAALFVGVLLTVTAARVAFGTWDSFEQLLLARALVRSPITDDVWIQAGQWGVFLATIHAPAFWMGDNFLITLQPAFAFSLFGAFGYFCAVSSSAALGVWRRWLPILSTLLLVSTYFVVVHSVYAHTNIISAAYLLPAVGLMWRAHVTERAATLRAGLFFLLGFAFARTETPLFAVVFLLFALTYDCFPARVWRVALLPFTLILLLWHGWLLTIIRSETEILSPTRLLLIIGALAGTYAGTFVLSSPIMRRRLSLIAHLSLAALFGALIAAFVVKPGHMLLSTVNSITNLFLTGFLWWGMIWYFALVVPLLLRRAEKLPFARILTYGSIGFFLLTWLIGIERIPYRIGWGDSSNRMFVHILPVLLFYVHLRVGQWLENTPETKSAY